MPLLSLLVPLEWLVPWCCWHNWQHLLGTGMVGASTMSGVSWMAGSTATVERGGWSWGCKYVFCDQGCLVFGHHHCGWWGKSHRHLHSWRDRVVGPTATAIWFPVVRRPVTCALSPLILLGSLGLWAQPLWQRVSQTPSPLFLCVPLHYMFQSTHSYMFSCVQFSGVLLFGAEVLLLSYGCFTGCRLKRIDKGSISSEHDAAIALYFSSS